MVLCSAVVHFLECVAVAVRGWHFTLLSAVFDSDRRFSMKTRYAHLVSWMRESLVEANRRFGHVGSRFRVKRCSHVRVECVVVGGFVKGLASQSFVFGQGRRVVRFDVPVVRFKERYLPHGATSVVLLPQPSWLALPVLSVGGLRGLS
jgi:hypothetical protein